VTPKRVNIIWFFLAGILIFLIIGKAEAQHECQGGHNCNDDGTVNLTGGDLIGGDISTGGNKSLLIAPPGLGDVAIARCLGSEAWTLLIGGKQKLVLNQVCMAEFYLKVGRYDLAAQALCNQPGIIEEYPSEVSCEIDHDFTPAIVEGEDGFDLADRNAQFDEHYELAQQQEHEIEYLREEQASLVGRIDYLTERIERAPVQQQQIQQIDTGAERRANSRAAYEKALTEGTEEDE